MFFRDLVGEAVPKIQGGRMHAFAPTFIGLGDPSRPRRRHRHDLEAEPADQARHFLAKVSPRGDDERFGNGAG